MKTAVQRQRRAISTIIATILVVAMTIVAGGVLYTYFSSTASRAQVTNQVQVSADLVVASGTGTGTSAVTVTNSGSVALTGLTLAGTIVPATVSWNPAPSASAPVPPGSATSTTFSTSSSVTSGTSYTLTISATFANGATSTQVVIVTAH